MAAIITFFYFWGSRSNEKTTRQGQWRAVSIFQKARGRKVTSRWGVITFPKIQILQQKKSQKNKVALVADLLLSVWWVYRTVMLISDAVLFGVGHRRCVHVASCLTSHCKIWVSNNHHAMFSLTSTSYLSVEKLMLLKQCSRFVSRETNAADFWALIDVVSEVLFTS